ncbi:MAG: TolC family protein [Magnetococcus sp. THC-1_WYH]
MKTHIPTPHTGGGSFLRLGFSVLALSVMAGCALRPEPIPPAQHQSAAQAALQQIVQNHDPIEGTLTLYEAIARALRDNLDQKVRVMEAAMYNRQFDLSRMDLLPQLAISAGYSGRDKILASNSYSVTTGIQSLETSTSQDRDRLSGDLVLSWNILDFGVSYVRAKQASDRYLVAEEQRRKVVHNIVQEVRSSYWRTVSADRLLEKLDPLLIRVNEAWQASRANETSGLQQPLESLKYQQELADMLRSLRSLRKTFVTARTELSALMNVSPGSSFTLPSLDAAVLKKAMVEPVMSVAEMEETALATRPEVREQHYQNRISVAESKAALLGMLPGISLDLGGHGDSNSYLLHDTWGSAGAAVSWNLFKIFSGPANLKLAAAQAETEKVRLQALNVAVLAQVHIALHQFNATQQEYLAESRYFEVEQRILQQIKTRKASGQASEMEEIRASLSALLAEIRRDQAFIQLQGTLGRLYASVGFDPLPASVDSQDLSSLATVLEQRFNAFFGSSHQPAGAHISEEIIPREYEQTSRQTEKHQIRVAASPLNLRASPDRDHAVVRILPRDERMEVLAENPNGWLKVQTTDGATGWVAGFLTLKL